MCADCAYEPEWVEGDAEDVVPLFRAALRLPKYAALGLAPDTTPADMVLSCPPYFNLEQVARPPPVHLASISHRSRLASPRPRLGLRCHPSATCSSALSREQYDGDPSTDLSMLSSYAAFKAKYEKIVANVCSLLREGHTATFVVANLRDTKGDGRLLPLHKDTIDAFEKAGMVQVNDAVLQKPYGTAAMRAERTMSSAAKLVPTHQNVCVFSKGVMLTPQLARRFGMRPNNAEAEAESQASQ